MATLLLELFSEEIPSRMQKDAASQLSRLVADKLKLALAMPGGPAVSLSVHQYISPRHLAISVGGLPLVQPDYVEEKRGPKIGAPEQAMKGFLQSSGLTLEQCEQRDGYYYATIERKGRPVADVVKEICESALASFGWPKSMHWGSRDNRPVAWVRPLHRIVCLLDDAVVPVQFAHLTASNLTEGHRFMAPVLITITHAEKYEALLKDANVVVDYAARRERIKTEIAALAAAAKLSVAEDEALLDEVTGLVEWPVPLLCQFDKKFLDLPPEVLISEMKNHQRYFALKSADGKLSDQFITVANMETLDSGAKVKEGNARVVRARLADGEFYWEQDRKVSLEDWGKKLSDVVFHAKVGMMNEKVSRIETLAVEIAKAIGYTNEASVRRAAKLCKADLTSGMVGEFPELQGIMGRYYAIAQGESAEIADAIRDHYKPLGAADSVPESPLAAIIAIADKLDSITSLFAAGEKPTGSKDPLALRRAALGVIYIIIGKGWNLDLTALSKINFDNDEWFLGGSDLDLRDARNIWLRQLNKPIPSEDDDTDDGAELYDQIEKLAVEIAAKAVNDSSDFFYDRLRNILREEGLRHDAIEAITAEKGFNALAIATRTRALATWLATDAGKTTLAAIKRAMNILAAEEKKAKTRFVSIVGNGDLFLELEKPEEKELLNTVQHAGNRKVEILETLTAPINAFFEASLVTEEGFREARLGLLAAVRDAANTIADFSKIEG